MDYRRKIGLVLKKTFGRFLLKWNKLRKWNRKKVIEVWVYENVQCKNLIIHILHKIYIFKTCWTLKLQENESQKSEQVVFQILGWYLSKILFGRTNFFTRWQITAHIRAPPFPYMFWVIWTIYFHNFHTIYEVDILFRSSMGSLADFDMNSTSKKHIKRTRMCVIARCHITNGESIIFFFIFKTFSDPFSKIIEWMLSFELLAWKQTEVSTILSWFFMFIAISK